MSAPQRPFTDVSTLAPFPARPTVQRQRSAWVIGLVVMVATTGLGVVLGPGVVVVAFDLAPLNPLVVLLGAILGGAYGFAAGVLLGAGSALVVALARASRTGGVAG